MADPAPKKYSQQNYWRYIFAPMFMIVIGFGIYILFTMNDSQSMSLDSVTKQVNSMSGTTNMENALPSNSRQMVLQKGRTNIYEELNN
jgi:hypothetical protein